MVPKVEVRSSALGQPQSWGWGWEEGAATAGREAVQSFQHRWALPSLQCYEMWTRWVNAHVSTVQAASGQTVLPYGIPSADPMEPHTIAAELGTAPHGAPTPPCAQTVRRGLKLSAGRRTPTPLRSPNYVI